MEEQNTLRSLIPDNQNAVFVKPNDSLAKALTIMQINDFSQLPVVDGDDGEIVGALTWKSIAIGKANLECGETVKDYMVGKDDVAVLTIDTPLMDALYKVLEYEYAFVVDKNKKLLGIVTTADLSEQYIRRTHPFVVLEHIEKLLRSIIEKHLPKESLPGAKKGKHPVDDVSELKFNQYLQILGNSDNWDKLGWKVVDSSYFLEKLDEVRVIRNEIMHFRFDDRDGSKMIILNNMASYLQMLAGRY